MKASHQQPTDGSRRSFIAKVVAVVTGGIALLVPLATGVVVFLSPLFRRAKSPRVRVALLDQVPDDGLPRSFAVVTAHDDAWTRYSKQKIGAVYLVRQPGEATPRALSAKCPHAGCFVGYTLGDDRFKCPCHTSAFLLDGARVSGDAEVSPRDMDELPVELIEVELPDAGHATEVWVEFIDYQTGRKKKIPSV